MLETPLPVREMRSPLSRELSELILLHADLQQAIEALKLCRDRAAPPDESPSATQLIQTALMRDAITLFVGCFESGVPFSIDPNDVYGGQNGGMEYFLWLKKLRDTWTAHRLGPQNQAAVGIVIEPGTGRIVQISNMVFRYCGPRLDEKHSPIDFMEIALRHVNSRLKDTYQRFEAEAESLSPRQRLSLPIAKTFGFGPDEVRLGRKKFGNVRRESQRKRSRSNG